MSERKDLLKISYHTDDETGMHYIGEIDGCLSDEEIDKFIERFGDKGISDLMNHFAYLIYKFKQRQLENEPFSVEGATYDANIEIPCPPPETTFDKVKRLILEQIHLDENDFCLLPKHRMEDLGLDSLDKIELIIAVEDTFDIAIDDEEVMNLITVQSVVDFIDYKLSAK